MFKADEQVCMPGSECLEGTCRVPAQAEEDVATWCGDVDACDMRAGFACVEGQHAGDGEAEEFAAACVRSLTGTCIHTRVLHMASIHT